MIEQFFSDDKDTIAFVGVVASILTLYLAYRIQGLLGKTHINTKQIDHVCELIEELNQSEIEVKFCTRYSHGGIGGSGHSLRFNIFELGNYDKVDSEGPNKKYEDEKVLFDSKCNQILNIKHFINHPLTPRVIADELVNFYITYAAYLSPEDSLFKLEEFHFVEISTGILEPNILLQYDEKSQQLIQGNVQCMVSWLHLKECSKNLKVVIGKWLVDHGIEENNIREDFKNRSL